MRAARRHEHLHPPRPAQRRPAAQPAGPGTGRHGPEGHGHRRQLRARRARRDHPLHPQGRHHPDRDRGQRPDRRAGEQGRAHLRHHRPQPRRPGPLPGHRRGGGGRRLHRRALLRRHRQHQRGGGAVGLRLPGLRLHRRPLRQEGGRRHRPPGALSGVAHQHLPERRRLRGPDRVPGRPGQDRLDHHPDHPGPGRAADRQVRRRGDRGLGPAQGRLLVPDRGRRHLPGGGRHRPPEDDRGGASRAASAAAGSPATSWTCSRRAPSRPCSTSSAST